MACISKRRGKYVVDYRDGAGIRRWVTCETRREAETVLLEKAREARQPTRPVVDPNITVSAYAEHWLREIAVTIKPKTQKSYGQALRLHILPALGPTKVRMLQRGRIKSFLVERLQQGKVRTITESEVTKEVRLPLARDSVRVIHATLRALLNAAVDDGVIVANPANKLGRTLRLVVNAKTRQEEVKAMTRDQLAAFLVAARNAPTVYERRHYPLFLLLARTGMRLGDRPLTALPASDAVRRDAELGGERRLCQACAHPESAQRWATHQTTCADGIPPSQRHRVDRF